MFNFNETTWLTEFQTINSDQRPSVASYQKFADYAYKSSEVTSKIRRVKIPSTMKNFQSLIRKVTAT